MNLYEKSLLFLGVGFLFLFFSVVQFYFESSAMIEKSSSVVVSPVTSLPSAISLRTRRMILPDLVFGSELANLSWSGFAIAPMSLPTCVLSSALSCSVGSMPSRSVTKAAMPVPLISCGIPTTAASATESCDTSADSTSAVPRR